MEEKNLPTVEFTLEKDSDGVFALSFTQNPAIEEEGLLFSKNLITGVDFFKNIEHRILTAPALIPDKLILRSRKNEKGEEEYYNGYFSKETVKEIAQKFFKNKFNDKTTLEHQVKLSDESATVFESWIIEDSQKDKSKALGLDLPVGTWMVSLKIHDNALWQNIKNNNINALSVEALLSKKENFENIVFEKEQTKKNNTDNFMKKILLQIKNLFSEIKFDIMDVTLEDGRAVQIDTETNEIETIVGEPVTDGVYKTLEGNELTVKDGKYVPPAMESPEVVEEAKEVNATETKEVEEVKTELAKEEVKEIVFSKEESEYLSKIEKFENEIKSLNETIEKMNEQIKTLESQPAVEHSPIIEQVDTSKLTASQKLVLKLKK
jgi:hypothetical protein